ncbi:MAG: CarD family transcriptional regulator [Firmicutes bacterium]|nr:CarD family transcriptional regulator [Bacillota bacterium]MBQ3931242.1 CarD family transcriptional regulator [Bacillota bacterium]MBR3301662.1 CarD family transcriptional regulator [Bacillota bacterium]
MFTVGDKVVYPMHGAGLVEKIEDRQILGETRAYYIIRIKGGNMQVMVPVRGAEDIGLRYVVDPKEFDEIYKVLGSESTPMDENWNRRNRDNMEKLKTGDPEQVAEVIRNLVRVDRVKKLSTGEKKLLNTAKQILCSEMTMVLNVNDSAALALIDGSI